MGKKEKKRLARIVTALCAFAVVFAVDKAIGLADAVGGKAGWVLPFALYLAVYLLIGYDVLWRAVRNIAHGQVFDENFLMCVATLGAFALAIYRGSTGREIEGFDEACAVLLFYQVGEFFQDYATGKSRRSVSALMDIRPDYACVRRGDEEMRVDPSQVQVGELVVVRPGEKVPLDGTIAEGRSTLDTRALTGESAPCEVREGDSVVSGSVNMTTQLTVRVEKAFYDSTVSKILDLVENAAEQKSKAEHFITKFARVYTPAVVAVALVLAVVPSLITGAWSVWVYRALSFLVVSCPCALVISIPLSFFAGIGAASRCGILVKGSDYLERFHRARVFVFDKTGTLTHGNFVVAEVTPAHRRDEILRLAATAEQGSSHPIAQSIAAAYGKSAERGYTLTAAAGEGVLAVRGEEVICCGNEKLMRRQGIAFTPVRGAGTAVYVAKNGKFEGALRICDEVKEEAPDVVRALHGMGCRTVMLTGDNEEVASAVAKTVGVTKYKSSLLPQNKVEETEAILAQKKEGENVCFVGDGINDAPVLMRADVGVAMGGLGSDAAIEASDVVLMRDDLRGLPLLKRICVKTMTVVWENILFTLIVKAAILVLAAFGIANMWLAVFGDVGVAVLAILNAMRVNGSYAEKHAPQPPAAAGESA